MKGSRLIDRFGRLSAAAAAATWLPILLGGAVCFTGSAKAIPDWPTSFGGLVPPASTGAIIEYVHRLLAVAAGALIAATAVVGILRFRRDGWLCLPPILAVGFLIPVVILGARAVLSSLSPALAIIDLGFALMVLALTVATADSVFVRKSRPAAVGRPRLHGPLPRLALGSWAAVFLALALTAAVGPAGAPSKCLGWPAWARMVPLFRSYGWLAVIQYCAAAAATLFVTAVLVHAWRSWRAATGVLCTSTIAAVLFFSSVLTSELAVARGFSLLLLGLRVTFASGAWVALSALLVLSVQVPGMTQQPRPALGRRLLNLILLTRPGVVLLLLVAAIAGSIVAYRSIPPLGSMGWIVLGLAMATGGAQALNQYIEREADARMARTSGRPLPSGRLAPAEALAWGLGLCLAALSIMAELVSWTAALLTLAGICWYVLLYTVVLKRRTAQSIVFGGLAGGLLPVIGSVSASGKLTVPALLLGVSIFLWTPPHFWSYALLHLQDYSNAGVPVAPLVFGAQRARNAILAYTVALVMSTFLLVLFRSAGPVFLGAAILLGVVLLAAAFNAWWRPGQESALRLYRLLSLYLGLLLAASAVDVLI
jgi:protoheme IX farnesyltransferase